MGKTKKSAKTDNKKQKVMISKTSKNKFKERHGGFKSVAGRKQKFSTKSVPMKTQENRIANKKNNNSEIKTSRRRFKDMSLRERMMEKLKSAKFRFVNEQLYTSDSKEIENVFKSDTKSYTEYHEGFRQQVAQWPINPVDVIIKALLRKAKLDNIKIADFGCGEAKIAERLQGHAEVYSFDLVALNDRVVQCDMAHTKLKEGSIDIAVFCLSLMGTNLSAYIAEANRVLKIGGLLKIAEVESRFHNVDTFIKTLERFGFEIASQDLSHKIFYFLSFKKITNISKKRKNKLPELNLKPCLYKKR